jgi:hypothetical protein
MIFDLVSVAGVMMFDGGFLERDSFFLFAHEFREA